MNLFFSKNHWAKKYIAIVLIISFLAPGTAVLLVPRTAHASVPTHCTSFLDFNCLKENILDLIGRILVAALIRSLTDMIISWIQGDDGANVGFVGNLEQELRRQVDARAGEILNQIAGIDLCGNIGAHLQLTLRVPGGLRQELECTLTDIIDNVESFFTDFRNGGWETFLRMSLEPQNNPQGAWLLAVDAKLTGELARYNSFLGQINGSYPFLGFGSEEISIRNCVSTKGEGDPENPGAIPGAKCTTEKKIKTPGTLVEKLLEESTTSGFEFAYVADEIDEAISAIINALIQRLISESSGLFADGGGGSGIFDPGLSSIGFDTDDVADSILFDELNDGLFTANEAIIALDEKLINDRRDLFNTRQEIERKEQEIQDLLPQAGDDLGIQAQIDELQRQIDEDLQPIVNDLIGEITFAFNQKRRILSAREDIILLKEALEVSQDIDEFTELSEDIPDVLRELNEAMELVENISTPTLSSGDRAEDNLAVIEEEKIHINNAIIVANETLDEADRVIATTDDPSQRSELVAKKPSVSTQRDLLQELIFDLQIIETDLATADEDVLRDIVADLTILLLDTNRFNDELITILKDIDVPLAL